MFLDRVFGFYAPSLSGRSSRCNIIIPQLLWLPVVRRSRSCCFDSGGIIVGMWLERYRHRDNQPAPQLHAVGVGEFLSDLVGLGDPRRHDRAVPDFVLPDAAAAADRLDRRGARDRRKASGRNERAALYGIVGVFDFAGRGDERGARICANPAVAASKLTRPIPSKGSTRSCAPAAAFGCRC